MSLPRKNRQQNVTSINAKIARDINRAIILNLIRQSQPISRSRISQLIKLNKSTVSSIVDGLVADELVSESIDRNQVVGRNPINLRIRTGKHLVGAISIDSAKTEIAVVDLDGTIEEMITIKTNRRNPANHIGECIDRLRSMKSNYGGRRFEGIGMTIAGIVDSPRLKVVYAPNLQWTDIDVGAVVRGHLSTPEFVMIENDAKASALAEVLMGQHNIYPANLVFLSLGSGIGAGIVLDNHIIGGSSNAAGELGHVTIQNDGEVCSCGNRGCWEMYASDRATIKNYLHETNALSSTDSTISIERIMTLALSGDVSARHSVQRTAIYIGIGVANIIRSFDPQYLILGGAITQVWDIVYPTIMSTINERGFLSNPRNTKIIPTSLPASPSLLGAAALSIQKIFADYRIAL